MLVDDEGEEIKRDFPIFSTNQHRKKTFIYFDSAATTQKPKVVIDEMSNFYLYEYATVHRAIYEIAVKATERYDGVRKKVCQFLGARSEKEIVFTSGTTDSINLVAKSFGQAFLQEGDEVIISHTEHHANIVPWQMLALEKKIKLKVTPVSEQGEFDLKAFNKLLSKKTKLVSVAYITNSTGALYPVKKIIESSHRVGAKVMLDGAQAVGHLPLNVQELDVDFFAFSAHKMYGPTGVGVLYGKLELLEKMSPHKGGGDMIEKVSLDKTLYQKPPLRFEAGTPMIAEVIGMGAALDYIQKIGLNKIRLFEERLLKYATIKLKEIPGVRLLGETKEKGAIITFVIEGFHPLDVGTLLSLKGVSLRTGKLCAEPTLDRFGVDAVMRISFGIYNSIGEIDKFIEILKETLILLKPEMSY